MDQAEAPVVAICNQKGGVGKTALTTALATVVSSRGRVLVIDADPQANASTILGVDTAGRLTLADLLAPCRPADLPAAVSLAITPAAGVWGPVDVLPAERGLAARASDQSLGRESRLREVIGALPQRYECVLVDCPPSLDMLTVNALAAASTAVIVTEPRSSSVNAIAEIMQTIASVRTLYNPRLELAGIVVNRWTATRVDRRAHWDVLADQYGDWLLKPPIVEREIVAVAATNRVPVPQDSTGSEVMSAVQQLAVLIGIGGSR